MRLGSSPKIVSLRKWLQAAFAGFAASLLLAVVLGVWPIVSHYRQVERNLRGIEAHGLLLTAANRMSAERGPSNVILSIEPGSDAAARDRLASFRETTDQSLAVLFDIEGDWAEPSFFDNLHAFVRATQHDLAQARAEVDRIAALPDTRRSEVGVRGAVDGMIAVVDRYQPVLNGHAQALGEVDPRLSGVVLAAQSVGDLREFGGRIASLIIPSIARRQPLNPEVIERFNIAEGRLWEIQRLLESQTLFGDGPAFRQIAGEIRARFFEQGLGLLKRLVQEGRAGGRYSLSVSEINAAYVPSLKPLEDLRTLYLSGMVEDLETQRAIALRYASLTLLAAVLFLGVAFWLMESVRRKILVPLLSARDMIVSLADNQTISKQASEADITEMRTLFAAVSVLAEQTDERRRLMEHFRVQAETDRLTGLGNRMRFETLAGHALDKATPGRMGVLFFDLDLFKNVNDTFGHQAGDEVLFKVARRLETLCDEHVLIARVGGDEFAVLCDGLDEPDQVALAERIVRLLSRPFEVTGGVARIGSSVGIAVLRHRETELDALCRQADIALYNAKAAGRNRVRLFDDRMEATFRERGAEGGERLEPAA